MGSVPAVVQGFVERFRRNRDAYRSGRGNGDWLKRAQRDVPVAASAPELIDPFLIALGSRRHNEAGYAEAYKDVVHEDAVGPAARHRSGAPRGKGDAATVVGRDNPR